MSLRLNLSTGLVKSLYLACFLVISSGLVFADESQELQQVKKQLKQVNKKLKGAKSKRNKTQSSLEAIERDIAERTLRQTRTRTKLAEIELESAKLIVKQDALHVEHTVGYAGRGETTGCNLYDGPAKQPQKIALSRRSQPKLVG